MTSIWREHALICLLLGLLAIPIYFIDLESTRGGAAIGSPWISEDLFFGLTSRCSSWTSSMISIAILSFPKSGVLRIHLCSMALSVVLLVTGVGVYGKLLCAHAIAS